MLIRFRYLILAVIIVAGVLVRFWNFQNYFGFDYDQEINANLARMIIVNHKPILIGPETSVGGMYVGPYFNYVIAFFFWLGSMNPQATIWLNVIITILTIFAFYYFGSKIISLQAGLISAAVYAFSHLLINYDRILWNPTPMPLVALSLLAFLWQYIHSHNIRYLIFATVSVGISLQLHFTGLFLAAFYCLSLLLFCRQKLWESKKDVFLMAGILFFFLFPLIAFDLRHDFINSRHFLQFFFGGTGSSPTLSFESFGKIALIFTGFFRAIFYRPVNLAFLTDSIFAILLLSFFLYVFFNIKKSQLIYKLILLFFLVHLIGFSFYHGALPSQYFLPELAIFIFLISALISNEFRRNLFLGILTITLLIVFIFYNSYQARTDTNSLALIYKQKAVDMIVKDSNNQSFKVDFITDPGLKTGFNYLFWYRQKTLIEDMSTKTQRTYKIVIPDYLVSRSELTAKFGAIGVIRSEL